MRYAALILGSTLMLTGCTGGQEGRGVFVGSTPIAGGKISAFELGYPDDGPIGGATTDANGRYQAEVHGAVGDVLVCVVGGLYRDIATSIDVEMGSDELCALALDVRAEAEEMVLNITPATHLAYSKAEYLSKSLGISLGAAYRLATKDINLWLGCAGGGDVVNAAPIDSTIQAKQTADIASIRASVISGALSHQAKLISEARNVTPGRQVNSKTLLFAYADDLKADGKLDGRGTQGDIYQFGYRLSAGTARGDANGFAHGLSKFLTSPENNTGLAFADFRDFLACLSTADGTLFYGASASLNAFDDGPIITVKTMNAGDELAEGQILHATVYFDVGAAHDHGVEGVTARLDGGQFLTDAGHGSEGWIYHLDTRGLQDGNHWLDIEATSSVVKPGRYRHDFVVDNSLPVITVLEGSGWTRDGNRVRIGGKVNKAVDAMSVSAAGAATSTHPVQDGCFSFTVDVPCNAKSDVSLSVRDAAGNHRVHHVEIRCDALKPVVALDGASYRPENEMTAVYDPEGLYFTLNDYIPTKEMKDDALGANSLVSLSKYLHRLDYLPHQGLTAAAQNLPILSFAVGDPGPDDGARTESSSLIVEYSYSFGGERLRDWARLDVVDNHASLPVSFQTLHPDLWRKGTHRIEVRATDLAGNVSESSAFSFEMNLLLPPVSMSECQVDRLLAKRNYAGGLNLFRQLSSTDAHSAVLRWSVPLPANSLAPQEALGVEVFGGEARVSISRIDGRVVPSNHSQIKINTANACYPATVHNPKGVHRDITDNELDGSGNMECVDHVLQSSRALCVLEERTERSKSLGPPKVPCRWIDRSSLPQGYRVQPELSAVSSSTGPRFPLTPGDRRTVITTLEGPQFYYWDLAQKEDKGSPLHRMRFIRFMRGQPNRFPPFDREDFDYALHAKGMKLYFKPLSVKVNHSSSASVDVQRRGSCIMPLSVEFY